MSRRALYALSLVAAVLGVLPVDAPAHARSSFTCAGREATIVGTPSRDVLHGTDGPDVIVGRGHRDFIYGGGGHDLICGDRGGDRIDGGDGDDVIHGGSGYDDATGGSGDDVLKLGHGTLDIPSPEGNRYVADAGDDTWVSTQPYDELDYSNDAGGSHDIAVTVDLPAGTAGGQGFGHDTLVLPGLDRGRWIQTSNGDDTITGGPGPDVIYANGGRDDVNGGAGNDSIETFGQSTVTGSSGDDRISLGGGKPVVVHGDEGDDTISANGPRDIQLYGDAGDDIVTAATALDPDELLAGGDGSDTLNLVVVKHDDSDPALPEVGVDLAAGTVSAGAATSAIPGFENIDVGETLLRAGDPPTTQGFVVTGTDGPNELTLGSFEDGSIHGLGGDDHLASTGDGDDLLDGGVGADWGDGGDGQDTCTSIETPTSCEVLDP